MALKLKVSSGKGYDVEYWRLYRIDDINFNTKKIHGWLAGYVNKETRDLDKDAIAMTEEFSGDMPDSIDGDIRDFIYAYLKTPNPKLISEAVPEVLDENGNVVTPAQEAVYEEQNKWATAENV